MADDDDRHCGEIEKKTDDTLEKSEAPDHLTRNEKLVWETLKVTTDPLKAYDILDKLMEKGVRAPMTVYRALDGLEKKGVIHKLDGLNAFVLCNHKTPHSVQGFLICKLCNHVDEIHLSPTIKAEIIPVIKNFHFHMDIARLEIKGLCHKCAHQ